MKKKLLFLSFIVSSIISFAQQVSVARSFIETSLHMIKESGIAPTVISRNLYYTSAAMYDAWAFYQKDHRPFLLEMQNKQYTNNFDLSYVIPDSLVNDAMINEAISYAAYRILLQKHIEISGKRRTVDILDSTFAALGYDLNYTSTDYKNGRGAALGNYIAASYITYGYTDGSNEDSQYEDFSFEIINSSYNLNSSGNKNLEFKNRWQPISTTQYMDKKGLDSTLLEWNLPIADDENTFLTPQWALVTPFALDSKDASYVLKDGKRHLVYFDPGPPPQLDFEKDSLQSEEYKWNFLLVALWSSHLDPSNKATIDISPALRGNIKRDPSSLKDHYHHDGRTENEGHRLNPATELPYEKNSVNRADYLRVIAEFWVDGINTYGPPGHWFQMLNRISDHPDFEKKWEGKGDVLSQLEWDIKSYFTLGGALHDAAIASWGVKVAYDYIRPISVIRYMASQGQCSDKNLANYQLEGLPLIKGKIEVISKKDPLAKVDEKNIGKIKIYAWRGPDYINNVRTDVAGVGWILAEDWWPYQRYSFVTPPFSGYVSGHSCFSFASATILEKKTGNAHFPGGLAEFTAKKNQFLLFEDGPSEDITLQWATYKDAATETCLSRLWGGIHPPCDDMMGRIMGKKVANKAFKTVQEYFKN
ncbi:MAG: vanadium-dependent haloperoxidase [Flavobacteriales bacterium]|nr:vanadium-dependent haloperoxidase [Flavobacteriales bacterium]